MSVSIKNVLALAHPGVEKAKQVTLVMHLNTCSVEFHIQHGPHHLATALQLNLDYLRCRRTGGQEPRKKGGGSVWEEGAEGVGSRISKEAGTERIGENYTTLHNTLQSRNARRWWEMG